MRIRKPAVAVATAALMLVAAACGGGSDNASTSPTPTETQGEGGGAGAGLDPDAQAPAPEIKGATEGGNVTVLASVVPSTLDPTRAYFVDSTAILSDLVTRSLTQYVYRDGEMVLIPDMATDLGRANADNTEWTFTLREGLKYEDGTPVKAEDVAYAIKRSFAIQELPDGPTYNVTFFLDGDNYKGPFSDGLNYKGVEVKGNDIIIKMRRPFSDMPYLASFPAYTGIPQSADKDPSAYGNHPLATGPYMFDEYKPGASLTLKQNPEWDPATDPARHQYVDTWTFKWGEDTAKLENTIINDTGEGATSIGYEPVTPPSYKKVIDQGLDNQLIIGTSPCTYMWYLDYTKITDKDVRMAVGYAYPYQAAWKAGGEIVGITRVPSTTLLPPGTAGRVEYDTLGIGGQDTDPAKAKELLTKADALGFEIKFYFASDDPLAVAAKNELVKGLEAGGFTATPVATSSETIRDDRVQYDAPINVRSSGWCSDWPTGGSWFPAQWDPGLVGLEGMPNLANFKEPAFSKRYNSILNNMTVEEATKAWGELDKYMEETFYPAVLTGYAGSTILHGSKLGGVENDNVRGMPTFTQMYVTE